MKRWAIGVRSLCITLGCMAVLTGCVFQRVHYKSFKELREESASNYSQQVLEAVVGVCDEARLPAFFRVEAGFSTWTPSYSGSASAVIPTLMVGQTNVTGSVGGGEALTNQIQYNDFGSAGMTRVTALYSLLCFTIRYGNVVLPNGTFHTVVEKASSREPFLIWAKRRNGEYIGVTPAKSEQFLQFAHDVTYWTLHATPDLRDLTSTTGKFYRFSTEYNTVVSNLVHARLSRFKAEEAMARALEALKAKQQAFEALKAEAKTSPVNPIVLQGLLQLENQELQTYVQTLAKSAADLDKLDSEIQNNTGALGELVGLLESILGDLKRFDPDLATLDTDAILTVFRKSIEIFLTGDRQQLEAVRVLMRPSVAGHRAQESVDKLYRERFEALPQSFDPRRQGTQ